MLAYLLCQPTGLGWTEETDTYLGAGLPPSKSHRSDLMALSQHSLAGTRVVLAEVPFRIVPLD